MLFFWPRLCAWFASLCDRSQAAPAAANSSGVPKRSGAASPVEQPLTVTQTERTHDSALR